MHPLHPHQLRHYNGGSTYPLWAVYLIGQDILNLPVAEDISVRDLLGDGQ